MTKWPKLCSFPLWQSPNWNGTQQLDQLGGARFAIKIIISQQKIPDDLSQLLGLWMMPSLAERRKIHSSLSCRAAQNLKSPFCTLKPMPGVCRPANQTPKSGVVWSGEETDGTGGTIESHTPPKQKVRKARNSGIFRPLCLLIAQFCGAHRRQYTRSRSISSDERGHAHIPRSLHRERDGKFTSSRRRWLTCKWASRRHETIGQPANCPTHGLSRIIEIDVVSARPPHDILDRNYCHALAAAWLRVCVFCVSPAK